MTATTRDKMEFTYLMGKHAPQFPLHQLYRLMRYGATYARFATEYCNRQLSEAEQQKWLRVANKAISLCVEYNCGLHIQNDPRGCTFKVKVLDGHTNDWGQEGICVPTS